MTPPQKKSLYWSQLDMSAYYKAFAENQYFRPLLDGDLRWSSYRVGRRNTL